MARKVTRKRAKSEQLIKSQERKKVAKKKAKLAIRSTDVFPSELNKIQQRAGTQPLPGEPVTKEMREEESQRSRLRKLIFIHLNRKCTTIREFMDSGKSNYTINGYPLMIEKRGVKLPGPSSTRFHISIDNVLFGIDGGCITDDASGYHKAFQDYISATQKDAQGAFTPSAVITKSKQIIINGDEDGGQPYRNMNNSNEFKKDATVSFIAVGMLLGLIVDPEDDVGDFGDNNLIYKAADAIARGNVDLLDFIADEQKDEARKSVLEGYKTARDKRSVAGQPTPLRTFLGTIKPPKAGMTLMGTLGNGKLKWHRPATVVLSYKMLGSRKMQYWLIGMDEGSYFGVELPEKVTSVDEAYQVLMPKHLHGVRGILRQGEWYAVPVKAKDVPDIVKCRGFIEASGTICLPIQDVRSNRHVVIVGDDNFDIWTRQRSPKPSGEIRIDDKGRIFARDFIVEHRNPMDDDDSPGEKTEEHDDLSSSVNHQWYTFDENTAVRSVSLGPGGVD